MHITYLKTGDSITIHNVTYTAAPATQQCVGCAFEHSSETFRGCIRVSNCAAPPALNVEDIILIRMEDS